MRYSRNIELQIQLCSKRNCNRPQGAQRS